MQMDVVFYWIILALGRLAIGVSFYEALALRGGKEGAGRAGWLPI